MVPVGDRDFRVFARCCLVGVLAKRQAIRFAQAFVRALLFACTIFVPSVHAAALSTVCNPVVNLAKLNEVKTQGGGAALKFIEVIILGLNIQIDGWEIGYGDKNGLSYLQLGKGNCNINGTSTKDVAGAYYSYPTYITCAITPMNTQWGEFILKTSATRSGTIGGVLDYVQYDSGSCPRTPTYWNLPVPNSCVSSPYCAVFSASSAVIARKPDGTGSFTDVGSTTTTGGTNLGPGTPVGSQLIRNFSFSPNDGVLCANVDQTVTIQARDISGATKTNYVGTVDVTRQPSAVTETLTYTLSNAGQRSIVVNYPVGASLTLHAVDRIIPGTFSSSGTYTFEDCSPAAFETVQKNALSNNSPLLTQRAGASFELELRALDASRQLLTTYEGSVDVDLVDASSGASCAALPRIGALSTYAMALADGGKKVVSLLSPQAARNVRVRATADGKASCSTDNFAIRPDYFRIVPDVTIDSPATDRLKAGADFTLTASPIYFNAGVEALLSGYDGAPTGDISKIKAHDGSDVSSTAFKEGKIVFPAATGSSTTATLYYNDVGTFTLMPDAVQDHTFADVDRVSGELEIAGVKIDHGVLGDCADSGTHYARDANGLLGCNVGSLQVGPLGRFYPDHYAASLMLIGSCNAGNPASEFTYMDQDGLKVEVQLKALGSRSEVDPLSKLVAGYAYLPTVTLVGDNDGTEIPLSRLSEPAFSTPTWIEGWYNLLLPKDVDQALVGYSFDARNWATPVTPPAAGAGPYDNFRLKLTVNDPDFVGADAGKEITFLALDVDVDEEEEPPFVATGGVRTVYSLPTRLRYGRMQIGNAHGSELIPLPVALTAQYWDGTTWKLNAADSCSAIKTKSIVFSDWTKNLAACETSFPDTSVTLTGGKGSLSLRAPGGGNGGTVNLALVTGDTCVGVSTPVSATAAETIRWFGTSNPAGRATFGIFKAPLIDRRERY